MTADAFKQAHDQGYSKGYAAGKRRKFKQISAERAQARETALWQRAMLAAIPFSMEQNNWKSGDKPISSIEARMALAADVAEAAVKMARGRYRL